MTPRPLRCRFAALACACTCVAGLSAPLRAEAPELAIQGGTATASPAGAPHSETDWGLLRLSWGDRVQLRAELPWLRLDGEGARAPGGLGPVTPATPRRTRSGAGGGGSSPGPGGGPSPIALGSLTTAAGGEAEPSADDGVVSGLGDLRLAAAYRVAGGGARLFRIDVGAAVKLATADEEEGLGSGETDLRVGLSGEYRFWSLTLFGGLGYNRIGDPPGVELDDVVDAYLGIESLPLGDRVLLSGWVQAHPEIEAGAGDSAAVGIGARTLGAVRFELLATAGLTDASEDFSVSLGVAFGLRPPVSGPTGARR